jgi:hypothetical protein
MSWLDRISCIVIEIHPPFTVAKFQSMFISRGFDMIGGQKMTTAMKREPSA